MSYSTDLQVPAGALRQQLGEHVELHCDTAHSWMKLEVEQLGKLAELHESAVRSRMQPVAVRLQDAECSSEPSWVERWWWQPAAAWSTVFRVAAGALRQPYGERVELPDEDDN